MSSSGMCRGVVLVGTEVPEEIIDSISGVRTVSRLKLVSSRQRL
jgi:hypothetical protein